MNSIKDITIFPWDNLYKIVYLLKDRDTVYARNCTLKHVDRDEAKIYLNKYHLQGWARCSILLGLYYKDELVSIMTFGKPRYNKNYDYELIRYCSSYNVIGGAEKILKHFISEYSPKYIVSYCDNSKFSGSIYAKLNFKLIRKNKPSKHWYNFKTKEHYTDALIRQQGFSRIIHHCDASEDNLPTNNNRLLMIDAGFVEVYDCGQSTYLLTLSDNLI